MAQYNVYETTSGSFAAAQAGWSWGGFLFGWLWAVVNGLWIYAGAHFVFMIIYFQILSSTIGQSSSLLLSIVGLSVPVVYGMFGNQWLGVKVSNGGNKVATLEASSKEGAVMLHMQQQQLTASKFR